MQFNIAGLQNTSLIDFSPKIACVVFTQGCNFRCGYCHNPKLIPFKRSTKSSVDFFEFLKKRQGRLDGVVISGGEPTMQENLKEFCAKVKSAGFAVKLDTNGTNPNLLEKLINKELLDYIAMDIKAPPQKYDLITNIQADAERILESISVIMKSKIEYEFRTTVIKSQLKEEDFMQIGKIIRGAKKYYLQKFRKTKILDPNLNGETYTDEEFKTICKQMKKYVEFCDFR